MDFDEIKAAAAVETPSPEVALAAPPVTVDSMASVSDVGTSAAAPVDGLQAAQLFGYITGDAPASVAAGASVGSEPSTYDLLMQGIHQEAPPKETDPTEGMTMQQAIQMGLRNGRLREAEEARRRQERQQWMMPGYWEDKDGEVHAPVVPGSPDFVGPVQAPEPKKEAPKPAKSPKTESDEDRVARMAGLVKAKSRPKYRTPFDSYYE